MIKVSVLYENAENKKFNVDYYFDKHIPLVRQKLGTACKGVQVDLGIGGPTPGTKAAYRAMFHMLFDSVEAFQNAFAPNAEVIMADIPNYTDIQPVIQVSEVRM